MKGREIDSHIYTYILCSGGSPTTNGDPEKKTNVLFKKNCSALALSARGAKPSRSTVPFRGQTTWRQTTWK